jgi:mRNA interferase MazF
MRRGELWWADLPLPLGFRPVVLLSREDAYAARSIYLAGVVTTRIRGIPAEVPLGPAEGLRRPSVVNLDAVTTVPRGNLRERVALLSPQKIEAIDEAIRFAFGLTESQ